MQTIFTNRTLVDSLRNKVLLVYSYCSDTMMTAQGVPGFITISREIRSFRSYYDSIAHDFGDKVTQLRAEINQHYDELPQRIVNVLLDQVRVDGANPITLDSMRRLIIDMHEADDGPFSRINASIQQLSRQWNPYQSNSTGINGLPVRSASADEQLVAGNLHMWPNGDGRFHRVPFGFRWPSYNTSTLWNLWHFGDSNRRIGPYKCICRKSDLTEALCKVNYSRTKSIMKALTDLAIGEQMIRSASEINQQNNQAVFDQVMAMLMLDLYPEPHERPVDININTLCNRMHRNNRNNNSA